MAQPASGPAEQATTPAARLTGRGAVFGMALVFLVGLLGAAEAGWTVLAGICFVLGCVLAAWFTRPPDLLTVLIAPPLLFSGALIVVQALTASGSLMLSVAAGSVVVLVSLAPWLLAGLLLTVIIAWPRGLPRSVRAWRRELRTTPVRAPWASWAAKFGLGGTASLGASRHPGSAEAGAPRPKRPGETRPEETRAGETRADRYRPERPGRPGAGGYRPKRPGDVQAAGPARRGPGNTAPAAHGPKGPGSAKPASPTPRGPGSAKSAGPGPRTHRPAPNAPEDADEASGSR